MNLVELYNICPDFKMYVDKYARNNKMEVTTALKSKLVEIYAEYLLEQKTQENK